MVLSREHRALLVVCAGMQSRLDTKSVNVQSFEAQRFAQSRLWQALMRISRQPDFWGRALGGVSVGHVCGRGDCVRWSSKSKQSVEAVAVLPE